MMLLSNDIFIHRMMIALRCKLLFIDFNRQFNSFDHTLLCQPVTALSYGTENCSCWNITT